MNMDERSVSETYLVPAEWLRPYLASSLTRSRLLGLDPSANTFPPVTKDDSADAVKNVPVSARYNYNALPGFFRRLNDAVSALGLALFSANSDLEIFNLAGDPDLLSELWDRNLGVGTCLAERLVGTNALSLAHHLGRDVWLDGRDHYSDVLKDYICYAQIDTPDLNNLSFEHLLVIPREKYFKGIEHLAEYLFFTAKAIFSSGITPTASYAKDFINAFMDSSNSSYVILDQDFNITNVGNAILTGNRLNLKDIVGRPVESIFKATTPFLPRIRAREPIYMEEVIVDHKRRRPHVLLMSTMHFVSGGEKITALVFRGKIQAARETQSLVNGGAVFTVDDLIGEAPCFKRFKIAVMKAAQSNGSVLITGESGTGKELVAHSIHNASSRSDKPFLTLNCAALPKELINSELFGYGEGAFTGAKRGGSVGKFKLADGGTLFLDEIGSMPLDLQAVLLRVLEDHIVNPLGSSKSYRVDVRIVAASNQDLLKAVSEGRFRSDLYYRLSPIQIRTVPLRNHIEDLPLITDYILKQLADSYGRIELHATPELLKVMARHTWPGNVRELRNVLESMVVTTDHAALLPENLPDSFHDLLNNADNRSNASQNVRQQIDSYASLERDRILSLMNKYNGNKSKVAKELGITRQTLYARLTKYGI